MFYAIDLEAIELRRGQRLLLDHLTWRVPRGACCAVLGPNGAGKSTLLSVVTGYLWPIAGRVRVLGEQYGQVDLTRFRRRIGVLGTSRGPEFHGDLSVLETVLAGFWGGLLIPPCEAPSEPQLATARRELAMTGLAGREEQPFGELSSGERMRALLSRALVSRPELLILDEPTSALDIAGRAAFTGALDRLLQARPELSVALVTHYVEDLPARTRDVLLLREGRVVASGPLATTLSDETLSAAFDCEVRLHHEDGHYWTRIRPRRDWQLDAREG